MPHTVPQNNTEPKPKRLYFRTYVGMIENSVGTSMFRNFYVRGDQGEFDAMSDGSNSCAFYVSGLLTILKKMTGIHGTIAGTMKDLETSGWQTVDAEAEIRPGDVLVWEAREYADGTYEHLGFAASDGQAVSTSWNEKSVVKHDLHFGVDNRAITRIFRMEDWD